MYSAKGRAKVVKALEPFWVMEKGRTNEQTSHTVLKYIDIDDLTLSTGNVYAISAIKELATLIALSGGIKQRRFAVSLDGLRSPMLLKWTDSSDSYIVEGESEPICPYCGNEQCMLCEQKFIGEEIKNES